MSFTRVSSLAFTAVFAITLTSCIQQRTPAPPIAKIEPRVDSLHGVVRVDNYHWLREKGAPEVTKYLEEENAYTEAMMKHTEKLQQKLFQEMKGRIKETDLSVPEKENGYLYYSRTEEGKQYKILCRRKSRGDSPEEILLDENILAEGLGYLDVGTWRISPNQNLMAYTVDTNGSELYTVYIKDLRTGELLPDRVQNSYYSLEWGNGNKTVFYTVLDAAMRPYKLFRHKLGSDYTTDDLMYHETDQAYEMYISKTKSEKYILMKLESNTTSEIHYLNADKPSGSLSVIHPRQHKMEYSVYHHGNDFYIKTNDGSPNFKVMIAPTKRPQKKYWKEFMAHDDSVKIDGLDVFKDYIVAYERKYGLKQIEVLNLKSGISHYVEFPESVYTYRAGKNRDFDSNLLRFTYSSPVTPKTVYDYDMSDKSWSLKKENQVLGGYDKSQYVTERAFAPAPDGTPVPISLVYRKDIVKDGSNPLWLYGYGSYGSSSEPRFNSHKLSMLNRGFVLAVAHVRGGGEMGRNWYDQGMLLNKKNTFSDFIACAEYLEEQKYTSPEKLVISGGSAGGLLIGAVVNMRPDLFTAAIAGVPFVDVVNTMLDPSIPLTVIEYEEWGNPNEKEYFDYMLSYSPYDNVTAQDYPDLLITAGLNDARVQYWEPAKWTAKLRAIRTGKNRLLLKTRMGAGHFGASGRYDELRETAFEYAFILDAVGVTE